MPSHPDRVRRNYEDKDLKQIKCDRCFGSGYIPSETCDMGCVDCQDTCPKCNGSGKINA